MWQRIQTLYLALSTALMTVMLFSTKAVTAGGNGEVTGTTGYCDYLPYAILIAIIALLNLLALTCYRFRIFQMRTAGLSSIISVALQIWLALDFFMTHAELTFRVSAVFPVVNVILNLLAMRGILADEMLVESAYHLRKSRRERRSR